MKTLRDVLNEQIPYPEDFDMKTGVLVLTISNGNFHLTIRNRPEHGLMETQFSYHPSDVCEGKGICIHCGRTLFDY